MDPLDSGPTLSDSRTAGQRAADDALTVALEQVIRVYWDPNADEAPMMLSEYVVVFAQQGFDAQGAGMTGVGIACRDSDVPVHRALGLLEYAAARTRTQ